MAPSTPTSKMRTNEKIHVVNGYDKDAYTYIPVLVIGAGESGIAMACQLKQQLGFDQFRVFDRQSGFGGIPLPSFWFSFHESI